jgi:hypothetical protein
VTHTHTHTHTHTRSSHLLPFQPIQLYIGGKGCPAYKKGAGGKGGQVQEYDCTGCKCKGRKCSCDFYDCQRAP